MIKIKLHELDKHRNECTFRPYIWAENTLKEIGIEFTQGDSYDYSWIAQSSLIDKKVSLNESINKGLDFLSKIDGDYMILDGQDSTSLLGIYEIFSQSDALFLLKNCLLKNRSLYKQGWKTGRYIWGEGEYQIEDFDKYSDRILLSGTNWLSTHWAGANVKWHNNPNKIYDISAMFGYPSLKENIEYNTRIDTIYDSSRKQAIEVIKNLKCKVAKLDKGKRVSINEYYNKMANSKIIFAPFGYGAVAVRDLESAMFGSILLKPNMSEIDTETYVSCNLDYSNLEEKINEILGYSKDDYYIIVNNLRNKLLDSMNPEMLALHLYKIFKKIKNIE